ncbi:carboxypeptidase-like regulatory domain-containing protein [candidate division KSB1 bacterium]|nr:carboxypeptidase-like regulatory domain-containing protein [candidate division KSB1 bacterium]
MKMSFFLLILFALASFAANPDHVHTISGAVYGVHHHDGEAHLEPLIAANIYWNNTTIGTTSDADGRFTLALTSMTNQLIVRYVGYAADTLTVAPHSPFLEIHLQTLHTLQEVTVHAEKPHTLHHLHETVNTQSITQQGC